MDTIQVRNPRNGQFDYEFVPLDHPAFRALLVLADVTAQVQQQEEEERSRERLTGGEPAEPAAPLKHAFSHFELEMNPLVVCCADAVVGQALAALHGEPATAWTVESLARVVGVSRSVLADRFAEMVGQPPMQYLAQWRMQVAANLLLQGSAKVAAIGSEVGYESEAAFSRAFKKATGLAPGAWRNSRHPTPS